MALLADIDDSYTKTGKGTLTRWANKLSLVPVIRNIPFLGSTITGVLGYADTLIESARWLFRGKFGSAATVLASGTVGATVNALSDSVFWWGNAASGLTTGATLGTHARAATEALIGGVSGALGAKPQVLSSYPAAIGSIGSGTAVQGPGKLAAGVSAQRGEDANAAYARYMRGDGGVHVNELQSANGRGA
jgi:hypothetical protein